MAYNRFPFLGPVRLLNDHLPPFRVAILVRDTKDWRVCHLFHEKDLASSGEGSEPWRNASRESFVVATRLTNVSRTLLFRSVMIQLSKLGFLGFSPTSVHRSASTMCTDIIPRSTATGAIIPPVKFFQGRSTPVEIRRYSTNTYYTIYRPSYT